MDRRLISELLDNIVERIDEESELQGCELTYIVFITDPATGSGDQRFYGEMDTMLAMTVRAQRAITDHISIEEDVVAAVEDLTHKATPVSGMLNCPACKNLIMLKVGHSEKIKCLECGCPITILKREENSVISKMLDIAPPKNYDYKDGPLFFEGEDEDASEGDSEPK